MQAADCESLHRLRERCRQVRHAALPNEAARDEAVRRSCYLRHGTTVDGAFELHLRTTVVDGARVVTALEPFLTRRCAEARTTGTREPYEAYAADALVAMADDTADRNRGRKRHRASADTEESTPPLPSLGPVAMIHVRVDHSALRRGHTIDGEVCEIAGIGPIPVATATMLDADAILNVVETDGVDVLRVAHTGRTVTAQPTQRPDRT